MDNPKTVLLNGEPRQITCDTLLDLIQELQLNGKRFAVEVNEMIIPKSRLAVTSIQPQDKIEIIHAVGGG